MKEDMLKKMFKDASYEEPSNNLSFNIMEQINNLNTNSIKIAIPSINTKFIKFYFFALIAFITSLSITFIDFSQLAISNNFSKIDHLFENHNLTLIPIISLTLFLFLLIDRKVSHKFEMRKR